MGKKKRLGRVPGTSGKSQVFATGPLYHGGKPGMSPGDQILPPAQTGAASSASYGNHLCRKDRVYLTEKADAAGVFAAMFPPAGTGDLYRVEAEGPLFADPDCKVDGMSYEARKATIVEVVQRGCTLTPEAAAFVFSGEFAA